MKQIAVDTIPEIDSGETLVCDPSSPGFIFYDDKPMPKWERELLAYFDEIDMKRSEKRKCRTPVKTSKVAKEYQLVMPEFRPDRGHRIIGKGAFMKTPVLVGWSPKDKEYRPLVRQIELVQVRRLHEKGTSRRIVEYVGEDHVDPEVKAHHMWMEARRECKAYLVWHKEHPVDPRQRIMDALVRIELSNKSFSSRVKRQLSEFLSPAQVDIAWMGISPLKALRSAFDKPDATKITKTSIIQCTRIETKVNRWWGLGWSKTEIEWVEHPFKTKRIEDITCPKQAEQIAAWDLMHTMTGFPKLRYDREHRLARRTLFHNPDGTFRLNTSKSERSPDAAKGAFAKKHNIPIKRCDYQRVRIDSWNEEWLRQRNIDPILIGKHFFTVSERKPSDEASSNYYDPSPDYIEIVDEDGNWINKYRWFKGRLRRVINDIIPKGSHRLSVREFEYSLLSGAPIAEDEIGDTVADFEDHGHYHDNQDDRLRDEDDGQPHRSLQSLCEEEQLLHHWLRNAGLENLADIMTMDFTNLAVNEDDVQVDPKDRYDEVRTEIVTVAESQATATLLNLLQPRGDNRHWIELRDHIWATLGKTDYSHNIIRTLALFLSSVEEAASPLPGNECSDRNL